jgi:translation initiation factor 2 subunit 3
MTTYTEKMIYTEEEDFPIFETKPLKYNLQEELQPSINIGVIGHVSHGKSTVVKTISGKSTAQYQAELARNMTIKLGYANCKIWRCTFCKEYFPTESHIMCMVNYLIVLFFIYLLLANVVTCPKCQCGEIDLMKHISFVDCPGHEILMV